jgi:quercetin dioxygenase-like cupin family protein
MMIIVDPGRAEKFTTPDGDPFMARGHMSMLRLLTPDATGGTSVSLVTFPPKTRLSYHTHTGEQILYVTEGKGILATRNKEYTVTPGMVVFIPPGEDHWHGATDDSSFTHLAIHRGESKVSPP